MWLTLWFTAFFFLSKIGSTHFTDSEILDKNFTPSGAFTFFTHLAASYLWQQTNLRLTLSRSDNILYCMYHSQQRHIDSPCRGSRVVAFYYKMVATRLWKELQIVAWDLSLIIYQYLNSMYLYVFKHNYLTFVLIRLFIILSSLQQLRY